MDIGTIIAQAGKYLPQEKLNVIRQAYEKAEQAHKGQAHDSGQDYIQHSLNVAYTLSELQLDAPAIAAGLLHGVVDDAGMSNQEIEKEFGPKIALLVRGMTKLAEVKERSGDEYDPQRRTEKDAENLRNMLVTAAEDPRVLLIRLADRLHTMRTLRAIQDVERRRRIAQETLDIFVPLANRLGIYRIKWELEDLGFRHVNPQAYHEIAQNLNERRETLERQIKMLVKTIGEALEKEGIANTQIGGRTKHIYSIYRKMERKDLPFDEIYDIRAIRIIVDTIPECYHALGIVHSLWRPETNGFDDYIAAPKDNSYQSLHTNVRLPDGKPLEIQIRTSEMHEVAEKGIASHWMYKEGGRQQDELLQKKVAWLKSLLSPSDNEEDPEAFVDVVKSDVFKEQVYVFTPMGKPIDLPAGSTPIDFAYAVHTEVGHRCRGAKINGRLVSLDYRLQTGDQVEILTTKRGGPSRDWLNADTDYAHTTRAKQKIRQWFRLQAREQNIERGRALVEKELRRLSLDIKPAQVARLFRLDNPDEFFARTGTGDIQPSTIATKLAESLTEEEEKWDLPPSEPKPVPTLGTGIRVKNVGDLLTTMARCCHPVPGDEIIGYVTRGRGVTIHRRDCPNVLSTPDPERLIQVSWGTDVETFPVQVRIRAYDRTKLLRDIGEVFGNEDVSLVSADIETQKKENLATFSMVLQVTDIAQLSRVLAKLEGLPNVLETRRITK
ncbi:MAG: bifunctional (p)ppGpp synthetase/guanosine-3',5'-bis(diphosphate) 3'-pyrophosphohydrolase [Anaerolineae bacterium]|nr:bifunctional (p)ppGpp synthetase/guanosine-3',5'-bis(diphosphate) 3'-pyrophosphohydrolase [Anaerolineae bacterium]